MSRQVFTHDAIIWFGSFYYYVDALASGYLALWDPYMLAGTPFYPNIHIIGLLDPLIVLPLFMVKVLGTSILTSFIYFIMARLLVFAVGAYYLFRYVTKCRLSALVSAGVLFFSVAPIAFRQTGMINCLFLAPLATYFILLFFENIQNSRRYLYLFCFVGTAGVSLNCYIPGPFIFNVLMFIAVALAFKIIHVSKLVRVLGERGLLVSLFLGLFVTLVMVVPSAVLHEDSRGPTGELFPSIRIIQKYGTLKKFLASEMHESAISGVFTNNLGVYSSYGNALGLVYPDLWKQYFLGGKLRSADVISEAFMYIGTVALVFSIIGLMYGKSRYRHLAFIMLLLVATNLFSYYGVSNRPANLVQRGFNALIPMLGSTECKDLLSGFFLLYLCMLLSLGLKVFFRTEEFMSLLREKRFQIILVCMCIVWGKIVISKYYLGDAPYTSGIDLVWIVFLVAFAAFVYVYSTGLISRGVFSAFYMIVILTIFADVFYYNYFLREYVTKENWLGPILSEHEKKRRLKSGFEYIRVPYVNWYLAFGDTMLKVKGAMSKGNNHHFFTTKRYYDYMTHVPLRNQLVLSGVVCPIVQFFPMDKVKVLPKLELLRYFETADADTLKQYLFLSEDSRREDLSVKRDRYSSLEVFPDVACYGPAVLQTYASYLNANWRRLRQIRANVHEYLQTPVYRLEVTHFSPNEMVVLVRNQEDGYLYYNDGWSQYWRAFDGDREVPLKVANYNFKAVFLRSGEHEVHFVFDHKRYRYGVYAYYAAILFCLCAMVFIYRRRWDLGSE